MPKCPNCGTKIQLKLFGKNKKYHCGNCFSNLVEDKRQNNIATTLMTINVIIIPLVLSLLTVGKTYIISAACIGGLLIYNYIPKFKVANEKET